MKEVRVSNVNLCAFLIYHYHEIKRVDLSDGYVVFYFEEAEGIHDVIETYWDIQKSRRDVYINMTLYNQILIEVRKLVDCYKKVKVSHDNMIDEIGVDNTIDLLRSYGINASKNEG